MGRRLVLFSARTLTVLLFIAASNLPVTSLAANSLNCSSPGVTGTVLLCEDFSSGSIDSTKWTAVNVGNGATTSFINGALRAANPGGSCGYCGVGDGWNLNSKNTIPAQSGDISFSFTLTEVSRTSNGGSNESTSVSFVLEPATGSSGAALNVALSGNHVAYGSPDWTVTSGNYYGSYQSPVHVLRMWGYSNSAYNPYRMEYLTVGTNYSVDFKFERLSGVWTMKYMKAGDSAWTTLQVPADRVPDFSSGFKYSFSVGSGDGYMTQRNGAITGEIANVLIYAPTSITAPAAPSGVSATAGDAQATVAFSAPTNNGGATILSYTVTASPGGQSASGTSSPLTVTGLSNGTTYTFTATATNGAGTGPSSVASAAVTPHTTTTFMENFDGTSLQSTYWTPLGGAVTVSGGIANLACAFGRADTNGKYSFSGNQIIIEARFSGNGGSRDPRLLIVDVASANDSIGFGDTTYQSMGLYSFAGGSFNLPQVGIGNSVANYKEYRLTLTGTSLKLERGDTLANITETISRTLGSSIAGRNFYVGMSTGSPYCPASFDWIRVTSDTATTTSVTTVPGSPTGVSTTSGDGQAIVTFTAPSSNGGASVSGYTVTASPGGQTATGSSSPITVRGLANGTSYTFTVTATNSIGTGAASSASNSVTPSTVPTAPTGVSASVGNGQASVSFAISSSSGGAAISGYTVTSNPSGGIDSNAGSISTTHTITGLTNGVSYTFTVTATNSAGTSPSSSASSPVTPFGTLAAITLTPSMISLGGTSTIGASPANAPLGNCASSNPSVAQVIGTSINSGTTAGVATITCSTVSAVLTVSPVVPGVPVGVTAVASNTQATVSFSGPSVTGGATIISYTVTASPGGQSNSGSGSPITVTGLNNGTSYTFNVTASNSAGTGASSTASNAVTPVGVPTAPTNVTATPGNAQAIVSFSPSANNGGTSIFYYTVTAAPGGQSNTGAGSPITVAGLANGASYMFLVTATNSAGTSSASSASNAVTPAQPVTSISLAQSSITIGNTTTISPYPPTSSLGTCTSSSPSVATVSGSTVSGVSTGSSQITCSGVTATVTVQAPVLTSIALGQSALVVGNSTLISPTPPAALLGTCTSSNNGVATINGSSVVAVAVGSSTITCSGISTPVTVALPTLTSIGLSSATIYASTATTILPTPNTAVLGTCLSSNSSIANINGNVVTGVAAGTATISCGSSSTSITVLPPLLTGISLGNGSIAKSTSTTILPLPSAAVLTNCTSSNSAIASVTGSSVLGIAIGTATIACGAFSATVTVTAQTLTGISLSQASITAGGTSSIVAMPAGAGLGTCSSANTAIATVSGDTVTGVGIGAVTIQCGSITTALTVTAPTLTGITLANSSLTAGGTTTINPLPALANTGTCTSNNLSVATVSGSKVTAISVGSAIINCGSASAALTVTAATAVLSDLLLNCPTTIAGGQSDTCTVMAIYSNSTTKAAQVQWSSDNAALTINGAGAITTTNVTSTVWAFVTATFTDGLVTKAKSVAVQVAASALGACTGTKPYTMLLTINGKTAMTPIKMKANDPVEIAFCMSNFDGHTLLDVYVAAVIPGPNGVPPTWFMATQSSVFNTIQWAPWDLVGVPVAFVFKQAIQNQNTVQLLRFNIPATMPQGVTTLYVQAVQSGKRLADTANWSNLWIPGVAAFDYQP